MTSITPSNGKQEEEHIYFDCFVALVVKNNTVVLSNGDPYLDSHCFPVVRDGLVDLS